MVAICFAKSLFLAPLFLAIPNAATAPIMVIAGLYLFGIVRHINLEDIKESFPAFLIILLMTITGSITDGIIIGLFTYILLSFISSWINRKKRPV